MKDALFMMPTPRVLANVVDQLDAIDMADRDTKGDLYEYMLGKIATAGQNGQFRTPRHIIKLMVEMTAPTPKDVICDPACGTAGFLVAASEHLVAQHRESIYETEASGTVPLGHVPRLRLRQHHAPHRLDEHAAARRREPQHPLPRLARPGPRRQGGEVCGHRTNKGQYPTSDCRRQVGHAANRAARPGSAIACTAFCDASVKFCAFPTGF